MLVNPSLKNIFQLREAQRLLLSKFWNKGILEVRISVSIVSNKQYESKQHRNNKHKICRPFKTLFRLEQNIFACYSPNKI